MNIEDVETKSFWYVDSPFFVGGNLHPGGIKEGKLLKSSEHGWAYSYGGPFKESSWAHKTKDEAKRAHREILLNMLNQLQKEISNVQV